MRFHRAVVFRQYVVNMTLRVALRFSTGSGNMDIQKLQVKMRIEEDKIKQFKHRWFC